MNVKDTVVYDASGNASRRREGAGVSAQSLRPYRSRWWNIDTRAASDVVW